jgi:hypothetical protein
MRREHHCLNKEKVPFSTVDVNDSILKLISEERRFAYPHFPAASTKCIT